MNNYIDERFINYKRPIMQVNKNVRRRNGAPLGRKKQNAGILVYGMKIVAAIFLLLLSTFSGEKIKNLGINGSKAKKAMRSLLVYGGATLALWGALVLVSGFIKTVTLLPVWSLIIIFAFTLWGAVRFSKN